MLCLKIELFLPHCMSHTDRCSCTCHDGPDQSLPYSGLVWYKPLSMIFFFNTCMWWGNHNSSFLSHKSSNIWINTATFGWGYYPSLHAHFFPRVPSHSPFPLLCYPFLCSLVSAHDKKECLHWTNSSSHDTSSLSFPLTVVNLKSKRSLQCGGEGRE